MSGADMLLMDGAGGSNVKLLPSANNSTSSGVTPEFTSFDLQTNGGITTSKSASGSWVVGPMSGTWYAPGSPPVTYYVKVTATSGAFTSGDSVGVWLALNVARSWRITQTGSGSSVVTFTVQIAADAAGASILDTKTGMQVTATVP